MRILALLALAAGVGAADVVVLKDGSRVAGRVVDKTTHLEVSSPDRGLRTFLKEEVDRIVKDPKELLGDSDRLYEESKKDYERALALASPAEQNAVLKEAIAKITRVREAYATALDLFPEEDKLGRQLMLVMQLMRLLRERVGSEIAKRPPTGASTPAVALEADDALAVLRDPAKRADPARRAAAQASFRAQGRRPETHDLATAALLFLSRTDAEMKLEGPALKAVQDYFEKPWLKEPGKHLEAAQFLGTLRGPAADALLPFAAVHASLAPPGPDAEKAARAAGLVVANGRIGSAEGHAVADLGAWIASGDVDLAVLAFVREHRATDTPAVRYVWSYALLRLVTERRRGFDRPVDALSKIVAPDLAFRDHVAALGRSIKAAASCDACLGEGKLRCTNCHGRKQIVVVCAKCKGKGKSVNALGADLLCLPCKGTGNSAALVCPKCKEGTFDCKQCDAPKPPPALEDMVDASPCPDCDGRGQAFLQARLPCRGCAGLGLKLVPKADPTKLLKS
jgi:hypothetical protein